MTERESTAVALPWHDNEDLRWAVRQWAARIGVRVRRIQVRAMGPKWASMSTAGNLTLIGPRRGRRRAPASCVGDYVGACAASPA